MLINAKLEDTRRRLLDLTRRNRLLNHKTKAAGTLRIVDEIPAEVYRVLVTEGLRMQFLSREEAPAEIASSLAAETGEAGESAAFPLAPMETEALNAERHRDRKLQTALDGEALQTRLLYLAREASSALDEQGANILYLTFGIVEWRESAPDSVVSRAPAVFVPVELPRKNVNSRHAISRFDDDLFTNPGFVELCKRQYRFDFPVFDPDGDELTSYFTRVEEAISGFGGWRLLPEIHVGLFSFAKYLMYRDLDPASWPESSPLSAHPLVRLLSGVEPDASFASIAIPDPRTLDDTVPPDECFQVLDADSSQQAAILAAKRGASAVIEGPPGTGKSQTIANIIAECLSEGKTVLFVAEKAAALDVVKRRLETVGLGPFVLELHSRKASKRAVLDDIQRSLAADTDARRPAPADATALLAIRSRLNAYVRQLHEPIEPLGISPFEAITRAVEYAAAPEAVCQLGDVMRWTSSQLAEAREAVVALDHRLGRTGDPAAHPWHGAGLVSAGLETRQRVQERGAQFQRAVRALLTVGQDLALLLGRNGPRTPAQARELARDAAVLASAPEMPPGTIAHPDWDRHAAEFSAWMANGLLREQSRAKWSRVLRPESELDSWSDTLERRRRQSGSIFRFLLPSWYRDNRRLRAACRDGVSLNPSDEIGLLETLIESQHRRGAIEDGQMAFAGRFGGLWRGPDSDWTVLDRFASSVAAIRRLVARDAVSAASAERATDPTVKAALSTAIAAVTHAASEAVRASDDWLGALDSSATLWYGLDFERVDLEEAIERIERALGALAALQDWTDLNAGIARCVGRPAEPFARWAISPAGRDGAGRLEAVFLRHFHRLWLDRAFAAREALAGFRGEEHEALVERFRDLDAKWLEMSKNRLTELVRARRPDMQRAANRESKLGIVQAEIRKQRNIMPLRKLFSVSGDVIQAIKPCFMMSPISVAQYLAAGAIAFDLVIFDEASQVEPADAYGAIARGRQLLLVGDERQLPPTSFFARIEGDDAEPSDTGEFAAGDLESILAVGAVRLPAGCRLRWHYRSRHASLIEFSNEKFYNDAPLRVFPSPHTGRDELGLTFEYVAGGVYKRGAGQFNPVEAAAVASRVMRHAVETPELSLGVGAFSVAQQRAIQDEIERLRRGSTDERVEAFFAAHADEPFFVKNLETIQGDEREVIFLSVGYGPDENGRISLNFGPLNREGGWRRLNVLITRARRRLVLFASFRADELNLGDNRARGVVALKDYLYYAEHGRMPSIGAASGEHDSPFEASVFRALVERGWDVHAQVGTAGFSIDLAVVDPAKPGRYLLGIECDGATYHSSATARDRDRLRQAVLESLGWTIHRIWSTDWFQRREQVLEKLLERLENPRRGDAMGAARDCAKDSPEPDFPAEPDGQTVSAYARGVVRYEREDLGVLGDHEMLARMQPERVAELIARIVRKEWPIHREEAVRVLANAFQTRATRRTLEAFDRGLSLALTEPDVNARGEFLWAGDRESIRVRHRGQACPVVKPELIAAEEFQAAVKLTVQNEFGLGRAALVASAARLLGFSRTRANLTDAIEPAIETLLAEGELRIDAHGHVIAGSR